MRPFCRLHMTCPKLIKILRVSLWGAVGRAKDLMAVKNSRDERSIVVPSAGSAEGDADSGMLIQYPRKIEVSP